MEAILGVGRTLKAKLFVRNLSRNYMDTLKTITPIGSMLFRLLIGYFILIIFGSLIKGYKINILIDLKVLIISSLITAFIILLYSVVIKFIYRDDNSDKDNI